MITQITNEHHTTEIAAHPWSTAGAGSVYNAEYQVWSRTDDDQHMVLLFHFKWKRPRYYLCRADAHQDSKQEAKALITRHIDTEA